MDTLALVALIAVAAVVVLVGGTLALTRRPPEPAAAGQGDPAAAHRPRGAPRRAGCRTVRRREGRRATGRARRTDRPHRDACAGRRPDGPAAVPVRPARRRPSATACSACCPASGWTTRPGRRSRRSCSPPTSASARPRSWSSGCAPGSRSSGPATPSRCAPCCARSCSPWSAPTPTARCAPTGADGRPAVVLVVGVNGTGKTTTVGKLARVLVAEGRTVLLGAADTFRAAAADQLTDLGRAGRRAGRPRTRGR